MALITRVSRLFRADFNAILDRLEEPDALLRQAMLDMEEALSGDQQRLRLLQHEDMQIEERTADLCQILSELNEELRLCLDADDDALAKSVVRRKLETRHLLQVHERRARALKESLTRLAARIRNNQATLETMRQKISLLRERKFNDECDAGQIAPSTEVSDEAVEVALLREKQGRRST